MRHLTILLGVVAVALLASGVAAAPPLDLPVSDVFDQEAVGLVAEDGPASVVPTTSPWSLIATAQLDESRAAIPSASVPRSVSRPRVQRKA